MNCIVAQSGGPTSVINSSLAGVIQAGIDNDFDKIYLSLNGIEGILHRNIREVDKDKFEKNKAKDRLMARPSSILGSCRFKLPKDIDDEIYRKIFAFLKEKEINVFVYIGGNDSMDTVKKLNEYIQKYKIEDINVVGCPKTIDNDLNGMDHSPGFGSAAKYIAHTLRNIRNDVDIYDLESVTIVEIMGRHAGWLAASSLLANHKMDKDLVNLVYVPEINKSIEEIVADIKEEMKAEKNLIIAMAEGFRDRDSYLDKQMFTNSDDGFNHPIISGVAQRLADYLREKLGVKARAVELNIVQRTASTISKTDTEEAFKLGYKALSLGINQTNLIPVLRRKESQVYEIFYTEVEPDLIANKEMKIPETWLADKNTFQEKMMAYALPLIQGELGQSFESGMPVYVNLCDFTK
ncbi:diphosphate--fructose-6-phosphate 1-phosphotransferase [uncultured Anaerococcus sp.]|uniref:diphosphate--fructose-6-phosphate 1-phosphotransferase n=1 Tax=uncultured Anaerococcus sp. TaxID=293428 RepID=UPI002620CDB3|nr:diphosphate--fructose-6-phosphate 1-phosphotransferase [uncultured Anaerococcus sp.]